MEEEKDPENEVVSILISARVSQDINRTRQSSYTKLPLYFCLNESASDIYNAVFHDPCMMFRQILPRPWWPVGGS